MRRIIFINRYYKPDHSATAQLLTELAEHLVSNGRKVIVITSRLNYESSEIILAKQEVMEGVSVQRIWTTSFGRKNLVGRAIDYLSFYFSCFFTLLKLVNKQDVLVAKTDPPMISVVVGIVAKIKSAKLINWIQDLFPEVAAALSPKNLEGPALNFVKYLRNKSLKAAHKNIVIGNIMSHKLVAEGITPKSLALIPNWVVGENILPVDNENNPLIAEWELKNKFIIGYSGNLGRAHDHMTMLSMIEQMQVHTHISFLFIGSGAGMECLKKAAQEKSLQNITFKPYQPIAMLSQSLSAPDVHIITLQKELEGLIVPSKFYGVLSVHKPILYIGLSDGELGKLISDGDCGAVFESGDTSGICKWVLDISQNQTKINHLKLNSKRLKNEKFNKEKSLSLWMDELNA